MQELVEWCGAVWSVGPKEGTMFRCDVVEVLTAVTGWSVGDHCHLTAEEIHPSQEQKKET